MEGRKGGRVGEKGSKKRKRELERERKRLRSEPLSVSRCLFLTLPMELLLKQSSFR